MDILHSSLPQIQGLKQYAFLDVFIGVSKYDLLYDIYLNISIKITTVEDGIITIQMTVVVPVHKPSSISHMQKNCKSFHQ